MVIRKFSELIADGDTNLAITAVGDYLLIYDVSEPLDVNKVKVVSIQDLMKFTTETARQPMVTGQAAGDLFYASAAGVLARLAKGTAGQTLKMNAGATAPEWNNNFIGAQIRRNSDQAIANITDTNISFTVEYQDTYGMFDAGSPTQLTIQKTGTYLIGGSVSFQSNATGMRSVVLESSGGGTLYAAANAVNGGATNLNLSGYAKLTIGDTLKLLVRQNSGGSLNIVGYPALWAVFIGAE